MDRNTFDAIHVVFVQHFLNVYPTFPPSTSIRSGPRHESKFAFLLTAAGLEEALTVGTDLFLAISALVYLQRACQGNNV